MNIDLFNYINQARKSGMGDDKIREGLLQAGWPVSDVEEVMVKAPATSVLQAKPKTMMSKTLAFIFVVIIIAVAGYFGGAYYMSHFQNFPLWPFEVRVLVPTFTPRPSPVATSDLTADWRVYTNTQYGFEFKYPKELGFSEWPTASGKINFSKIKNGGVGDTEAIQFVIHAGERVSELNAWYENLLQTSTSKFIRNSDTTIDGVRALSVKSDEQLSEIIYVLKYRTIYEFRSSPTDKVLLDQILATFKFSQPNDSVSALRDGDRYGDVHGIQVALELYKGDNNKYPATLDGLKAIYTHIFIWTPIIIDGNCSLDGPYKYKVLDNGKSFVLEFCLGQAFDSKKAGFNDMIKLDAGVHIVNPTYIGGPPGIR